MAEVEHTGREEEAKSDYATYLRAYIRTLVDQSLRARSLPSDDRTLWLAAMGAWDAKLPKQKLERRLEQAGFWHPESEE
ncbi:MAG: hypothetical protein ACYS8L_08075 [Planctomycetota bacterium]|jgi:hypothetical protein